MILILEKEKLEQGSKKSCGGAAEDWKPDVPLWQGLAAHCKRNLEDFIHFWTQLKVQKRSVYFCAQGTSRVFIEVTIYLSVG